MSEQCPLQRNLMELSTFLVSEQGVADTLDRVVALAVEAVTPSIAIGLLISSQGCTREQAEGLLRHAAAHDERSIVQVARRIIEAHGSRR